MAPVELALDRIVSALRAGPELRLAMLFGSAAEGRLRPDSDVDIAIVPVDPQLTLAAELDLQASLARACGREVDLVRLDMAPTLVRWQVARNGHPLIEATAGEAARFQASASSEYIDFRPAFEAAAEAFRRRLAGRTANG